MYDDDLPKDYGTVEKEQHSLYINENTNDGSRRRNVTPDPIAEFAHRDYLNQRQVDGANQFRRVYYAACRVMPSLAGSWCMDKVKAGRPDISEAAALAFVAYQRTCQKAFRSRAHLAIARLVVLDERSLKSLIGRNEWPYHRNASQLMPLLKEALDDLADYYGII